MGTTAAGSTTIAEAGGATTTDEGHVETGANVTDGKPVWAAPMEFSVDITLGAAARKCKTRSWNDLFWTRQVTCELLSGGSKSKARQCAKDAFQTSTRCGNCLGDYIICSRQRCDCRGVRGGNAISDAK